MMNDKQIGPYYFCKGVGSSLKHEKILVEDKHVLQLDIDELEAHPREIGLIERLPKGYYVVTRTDTNSYNITSLNVFTFREVCEAKAAIQTDDEQHLKIGINRGYWILRLSGKGDRSRPEFAGLFTNIEPTDALPDNFAMSKPHCELYRKLYPEQGLYSMLPATRYLEGEINLELYATRVD